MSNGRNKVGNKEFSGNAICGVKNLFVARVANDARSAFASAFATSLFCRSINLCAAGRILVVRLQCNHVGNTRFDRRSNV